LGSQQGYSPLIKYISSTAVLAVSIKIPNQPTYETAYFPGAFLQFAEAFMRDQIQAAADGQQTLHFVQRPQGNMDEMAEILLDLLPAPSAMLLETESEALLI
jgi:hypothetical protein